MPLTHEESDALYRAILEATIAGNHDAADALSDLAHQPDQLRAIVGAIPVKMADNPQLVPVTAHVGENGKPASDEVALAGKDGKELARIIRDAKSFGVKRIASVMNEAAKRYSGTGDFLDKDQTRRIGDAIAAVNATAELLGRARVRDIYDQSTGRETPQEEQPFKRFADNPIGEIETPVAAYDYFARLYPKIGVDPERWLGEQQRRSFTLAQNVNLNVTADIQRRIKDALANHTGTADATRAIQEAVEGAGVTPSNPQYSEMVFRTNAMDAYQTGMYQEGQSDDVKDHFPTWQYLGIKDGRQGKDHEPHFDKYYPRTRAFADVRGDRVFNCRCSLRWVDKFEWDALKAKGVNEEG